MDAEPQIIQPYFDQYKSYEQDLGNIGSRYATTNNFYYSIISALMGIVTIIKSPDANHLQLYLQGAISLFAILLCMSWWKSIISFRNQFSIKFDVLRELEKAAGIFPVYAKEKEIFLKKDQRKGLIKHEESIPLILILPFAAIIVGIWMKWNNIM